MGSSSTVIIALKFEGGVVIGADSQATDPVAGVRWPCEKIDQVGDLPLITAFSGSVGLSQMAWERLDAAKLKPNLFRKSTLVRDRLIGVLTPVHKKVETMNIKGPTQLWEMALWGLSACWAEGEGVIIEHEMSGISSFHSSFHAIGGGAQTAYAIFRTLGGTRLTQLEEEKATLAALRIIRTCVDTEASGVSEPFHMWAITKSAARRLSQDELQVLLQSVDEWEREDQRRLFKSEGED